MTNRRQGAGLGKIDVGVACLDPLIRQQLLDNLRIHLPTDTLLVPQHSVLHAYIRTKSGKVPALVY